MDDSENRRISIPEAFLAVDAILSLVINITSGLTIYPKMIEKHLSDELPFIATENILMYCVKKGGDRQALRKRIRVHSIEAANEIKQNGGENNLIAQILADAEFNVTKEEISGLPCTEQFTGRAMEQTEEFLSEVRMPLDVNRDFLGADVRITV